MMDKCHSHISHLEIFTKIIIQHAVSAPVHPHVLIIVKTHENRIEHILSTLQMT